MGKNQIQIQLASTWNFHNARINDWFLMDMFNNSGHFLERELRHLNAVRMYMKVTTLSDIATAVGQHVTSNSYNAIPFDNRTSKVQWPCQPHITLSHQALWKRAL